MNAYSLICGCLIPLLVGWVFYTLADLLIGDGGSRPKEKRKRGLQTEEDDWDDLDYILALTMMEDDRK
jgi:hypothetical protein